MISKMLCSSHTGRDLLLFWRIDKAHPRPYIVDYGEVGKMHHQGRKILSHDFNIVWKQLMDSGSQSLRTKADHIFDAQAYVTSKGSHRGEEVIRIFSDGKEYARIYPCCWGHTTNCHGTRIGGYSESLDHWVR